MCKAKKQKVAPLPDPAIEQARIEAEAMAKANAQKADRKRGNRSSLLATGAGFADAPAQDTFG